MNESATALVNTSEKINKRVAETRRRICQVAASRFDEDGYAGVSVESIVLEAGVVRSTFYRMFQDKEDLLRQIIVPVFDHAEECLSRLDCDKPETIVNGIADSYLSAWEIHREALLLTSNIGRTIFPIVQDAHDTNAKIIIELMERLNEARMLRNDDAHLSALVLAQTATRILKSCETHPQFANVFRSTLRGLLLKW